MVKVLQQRVVCGCQKGRMNMKTCCAPITPLVFFFCILIFKILFHLCLFQEISIIGKGIRKLEHKKGIKITSVKILVYALSPLIHIIYT